MVEAGTAAEAAAGMAAERLPESTIEHRGCVSRIVNAAASRLALPIVQSVLTRACYLPRGRFAADAHVTTLRGQRTCPKGMSG